MERILNHFNLDAREDESLINFLNIGDKGSDTFVIQFGSHSIKFGLATQVQPFLVPTVVAYPGNNKVFTVPKKRDGEDVTMQEESKVASPGSPEDRV